MAISRRDFVKGGVALVSIGTLSNSFLKGAVAFAAQHPHDIVPQLAGKTLILVQMAGGNDGLNTLVPVGDPVYRSARSTLALPEEAVLPAGDGVGFHPALEGLHQLYGEGRLAVVQGVGYPGQDYSHFRSMTIWQTADPEGVLADGWLGRTLEALESDTHDPFLGFNVGGSTPPSLRGDVPIPSVADPADYAFNVRQQEADFGHPRTATLMRLYEEYPATSPYGVLLETTMESAVTSSRELAATADLYTPAADYPESSFGSGLSLLAQALVGGLGMRVGHITIGGFDTHSSQLDNHEELLRSLDEGLTAFYRDLEAHGLQDDVVVLTWSEFGRRVAENASGGTDHGAASVLFALGGTVQGGLFGEQPRLDALVDNGNLGYTTDFRSVYATITERWLGVPADAVLGESWPQLGFLPRV
ncbi:MAG: DUF1501 domain-containing protein [Dehalococcoidia bacterium]